MAQHDLDDLLKFLIPFPQQVRENALWLRDLMWDLYPDSNELIYDNYNALAFGFSSSDRAGDVFCSVAVYAKHINFGLYWGSKIPDPDKILIGDGSQYRYIKVTDLATFPLDGMKKLLADAWDYSLANLKEGKQILKGATITKAVAVKKRRPV